MLGPGANDEGPWSDQCSGWRIPRSGQLGSCAINKADRFPFLPLDTPLPPLLSPTPARVRSAGLRVSGSLVSLPVLVRWLERDGFGWGEAYLHLPLKPK